MDQCYLPRNSAKRERPPVSSAKSGYRRAQHTFQSLTILKKIRSVEIIFNRQHFSMYHTGMGDIIYAISQLEN